MSFSRSEVFARNQFLCQLGCNKLCISIFLPISLSAFPSFSRGNVLCNIARIQHTTDILSTKKFPIVSFPSVAITRGAVDMVDKHVEQQKRPDCLSVLWRQRRLLVFWHDSLFPCTLDRSRVTRITLSSLSLQTHEYLNKSAERSITSNHSSVLRVHVYMHMYTLYRKPRRALISLEIREKHSLYNVSLINNPCRWRRNTTGFSYAATHSMPLSVN